MGRILKKGTWVFGLIFSVSLLARESGFSQEITDTIGSVRLHYMDRNIKNMLELHGEYQKKTKTIPGYRIQLTSSTSRAEILKVKSKFLKEFPDRNTYIIYQQPYFKLRTGNYIHQIKAKRAAENLRKKFSGAFLVRDEVLKDELE